MCHREKWKEELMKQLAPHYCPPSARMASDFECDRRQEMMRSASQLLVLSGNEQWVDSDKNASLDLLTSTQKDKLQLINDLMFSLNFKRRGSIPDKTSFEIM